MAYRVCGCAAHVCMCHVGHVPPNGCRDPGRDRPRLGYVVSKSKETCAVSKGGRGPSGPKKEEACMVSMPRGAAANGLAYGSGVLYG